MASRFSPREMFIMENMLLCENGSALIAPRRHPNQRPKNRVHQVLQMRASPKILLTNPRNKSNKRLSVEQKEQKE
jgi:hypothetical protein